MSSGGSDAPRITVREVLARKQRRERLVMVSAYDALFARLSEEGGADLILVGDSLANVILGLDSTVPVTVDQMIHHGAAVCRGARRALVVVDMPFMSYQISTEDALRNAGRIMKETNAHAVKVEGGDDALAATIHAMTRAGIPVMGHIGFTPQSVNTLGGYRVQGRGPGDQERLIEEAKRVEAAGAFSLVLELVPAGVAQAVTEAVGIPTIGIGAGQPSRVMSARVAALKAEEAKLDVAGAVLASDAFFPFRDGIDAAVERGVVAVVQPGGSMRDDEVIGAADEHGMTMIFTGMRHFRH